MKKIFFVIGLISFSKNISAQNALDTLPNCSKIINELSYYWKIDSLANNGFRRYTYEKFLACKIDKVDRALLFGRLGKPNKIERTNKYVEYKYYYFDRRTMPKDFTAPNACWYIGFRFDEYEKYLLSIIEGDIDL